MTRRSVTDEQYGRLNRKLAEVARRVDEGTIPFDSTMIELQQMIEGSFSIIHTFKEKGYAVAINYDQSLLDMIEAGHYDWIHPEISLFNNFPIKERGTAELEIQLFSSTRRMSSKEVLAELDKNGLRAATLPELLAFGARYPEAYWQFEVVALGSIGSNFNGNKVVPFLGVLHAKRRLNLDPFGAYHAASPYCRFAAVSK